MDPSTLFIFQKLQSGQPINIFEISLMILILPILTLVLEKIKNGGFYERIKLYFFPEDDEYEYLFITGEEIVRSDDAARFSFNDSMLALSWVLLNKGHTKYVKSFPEERNGYRAFEENNSVKGKNLYLVVHTDSYLEIKDGIFICVNKNVERDKKIVRSTYVFSLRTKKTDLQSFVDENVKQYQEWKKTKVKDDLMHFVYTKEESGKLVFMSSVVGSKRRKGYDNFDTIFHPHRDRLIADIQQLDDKSFFEEKGVRRKKSYLFYGKPGCGKTATVMAMCNYAKRHIVEVPMSRVKTNMELEKIINLNCDQLSSYAKDEVIILFDEIDFSDAVKDRDIQDQNKEAIAKTEKYKAPVDDKLNLGTILSRLDGIGNYDGLIIIATTNCIDKLDPALCRSMRLTPMKFTYITKGDLVLMIEQFYKTKLDPCQKDLVLENFKKLKLSAADIKLKLLTYANVDDFLGYIYSTQISQQ